MPILLVACVIFFCQIEGLSLNLSKRRQLLVDGVVESNPKPSQNYYKSPRGRPKKIKVFRGTKKKKKRSVNDNVKVDFSVIRDETISSHEQWRKCLFL